MQYILMQMAAIMGAGLVWRLLEPAGISGDQARRVLSSLVYFLLLPALVFSTLGRQPLTWGSAQISISAATVLFLTFLLMLMIKPVLRLGHQDAGAVMLAALFPNVLYMGLPVLEALFGITGRQVAVQYDLFATTPLLFTLGFGLAAYYGSGGSERAAAFGLVKVPAVWAAFLAVAYHYVPYALPGSLWATMDRLAAAVVPLMLLSLGMALRFDGFKPVYWPSIIVVVTVQLFVMPLMMVVVSQLMGLEGVQYKAMVLDAAMPTMLFGIVICERFGLNAALFASVVTVSTLLSMLTLGLWYDWAPFLRLG